MRALSDVTRLRFVWYASVFCVFLHQDSPAEDTGRLVLQHRLEQFVAGTFGNRVIQEQLSGVGLYHRWPIRRVRRHACLTSGSVVVAREPLCRVMPATTTVELSCCSQNRLFSRVTFVEFSSSSYRSTCAVAARRSPLPGSPRSGRHPRHGRTPVSSPARSLRQSPTRDDSR